MLTWHAGEAFRGIHNEWLREGLREDRGDICVHAIATVLWCGRSADADDKIPSFIETDRS